MDDHNSEQSFWSNSGSDSEPDCIEKLDGSYLTSSDHYISGTESPVEYL